ncbi:MAG TPA: AmmeMemoRadiSam system protein A [Terriglobales bacterium]|nr:AmmeMemoRadiSam system protein A [Terriglobales bacterium]
MSLQPESSSPGLAAPSLGRAEPWEFSAQERGLLLKLAHESIGSALDQREISLESPSSHLAEPRGVFTTICLRGQLRGCVGYVFPTTSLFRAVAETARAAAFEDSRFLPVTQEEVPQLELSLSVLSPLAAIQPEGVEVGKHGLLVSQHGRRGLLLPQVPVEHGWDRLAFLEQACRKAGLATDAWLHGASLEAFTAEVFGDRDQK